MPQMSRQLELPLEGRGEAPARQRSAEEPTAAHGDERPGASGWMERVCERANLQAALKRVKRNKGSAGIDGMTVGELPEYLKANWPLLREQLLAGTYQPLAVRRQEIPKSGGGVRELGIPTVVDRFIQQAILQVLGPHFDVTFSQHSYGFRPGRSAHDAVVQAQRYVNGGRRYVVDVDLEKFFDRVNHDVLMGRLAKRVGDKRLLGLVRRYLEAGVMVNGVAMERHEGTPQGGPLSPLLANVLLDEVDKELEKRGHAFVRYADDCNVYVRSRRAGERVMGLLKRLYAGLRLRVNESKSAVDRPHNRKLLGYSFWGFRAGEVKRRVSPKAVAAMKVENALFATLDPTVRKTESLDGRIYTLVDTVGFVRHLPHQLVEAFKSTLEEVSESDLIVHVVDGAHPDPQEQLRAVRQVISEIGGGEIMEIIAINKADVAAPEVLMELLRIESNAYAISARTGYGIETLVKAIESALPKPKVEITAIIPFSRGDLVSAVHETGEIISEEYLPEGTKLHAMVGGALARKIEMLEEKLKQ